ncbi:MAG: hypothetical protein AAGF92_14240 [Myxococcota bacterium]
MERLKSYNQLRHDPHGRILDHVDYTDLDGNVIDNLIDHLP